MPRLRNRRALAQARSLLSHTERMLARASANIMNGDALSAMRVLRTAEHLNALDSRLRMKRDAERNALTIERALQEREDALDERERICRIVEAAVASTESQLKGKREEIRQAQEALDATYQLMRAGALDGPPPATGDETDFGVAPI